MSPKSKHVHKLKRHTYKNKEQVYFCVEPDCKYKISVPLSLGKITTCWRCGEPFQLNEASIRLAKPHCGDCTKRVSDFVTIPTTKQESVRETHQPEPEPIIASVHDFTNNLHERLKKSIKATIRDHADDKQAPDDEML